MSKKLNKAIKSNESKFNHRFEELVYMKELIEKDKIELIEKEKHLQILKSNLVKRKKYIKSFKKIFKKEINDKLKTILKKD